MGKYLKQSFSLDYELIVQTRAAEADFDELCVDYEKIATLLHEHEKDQSQKKQLLAECLDDLGLDINEWLEKLKRTEGKHMD